MRLLRAWFLRLWGCANKGRRERDLAEELESHVQMHIEDNLRAGLTFEVARRQALIKLGGLESTKELVRDRRSIPHLDTCMQDLRYGMRTLRKSPGFSCTAVVTLALGIGASTAIFSVVNGVLLQPLPYDKPEELVLPTNLSSPPGPELSAFTPPNYRVLRDQNSVFQAVGIFRVDHVDLTGMGDPEQLNQACTSSEVFEVLRVRAALGRVYTAKEDMPGQERIILLSDRLWRRRFNANPAILGSTLRLDDEQYIVLGVMPHEFNFPSNDTDLWTPFNSKLPASFYDRGGALAGQNVIARLKPGVSLEQAASNTHSIMRTRVPAIVADRYCGSLIRLQDYKVGKIRPVLLLLLGAVGFVLLVACANIANLLSIRGESRNKEIAVRAALGASTYRLIRQSLTESAMLSFAGGGLGLLLAFWIKMAIVRYGPAQIPRLDQISLDWSVVGFSLLSTLLAGIVAGLLPAIKVSRTHVIAAVKEGGAASAAGNARSSASRILVVSELALALILLVGAGLMIRSVVYLLRLDLGFDPKNVLAVEFSLPSAARMERMSRSEVAEFLVQRGAFFQQLLEKIRNIPGVESVAATSQLPLQERGLGLISAGPEPASGEEVSVWADVYLVTSGYFATMRIPALRGRIFEGNDRPDAPPVVVIDQTLAQRFWPGQDPIGRQLEYQTKMTVIGVTQNTRSYGLQSKYGRSDTSPQVFIPTTSRVITIVVRTRFDPLKFADEIRRQAWQLNPNQPILKISTMEAQVADFTAEPRFSMMLLSAFAAIALILGTVGIYGVTSHWVVKRTNEIGIRMALGADAVDVLRMVLRQSLVLAIAGITVGLAGAFALTRLMTGMIYGLIPTDPATFATVPLLLGAASVAAAFIPARRAIRVDVIKALRCE